MGACPWRLEAHGAGVNWLFAVSKTGPRHRHRPGFKGLGALASVPHRVGGGDYEAGSSMLRSSSTTVE